MLNRDVYSRWLIWSCRALLGVVFLYAAFPKLLNLDGFVAIIDAYGVVPNRAQVPVALVLSILEVACGIGIFFRRGDRLSLTIVFLLLLLFIGVLGYGLWLGLDIDCGCFGKDDPEHRFFSNLKIALLRDLFLLLPVAYLYRRGGLNTENGGDTT
jgi:uncharacterized membrane protein YphA (DoxX/SURF4 family)